MRRHITSLMAFTFALHTLSLASGDFLPISKSDLNSPQTVHTEPYHVKLPSEFPQLKDITRVDIYEDRWAAKIPIEVGQNQKEFNLFSITNVNEISALYECLQTDIMLPTKLALSGYASFQNWYSGTNLIIESSLLNGYSTVSVNFYERAIPKGGAVGKSESFAEKIFEYHAKNIDEFTQRFLKRLDSDKSSSLKNHSFNKPSEQWTVQQPAP